MGHSSSGSEIDPLWVNGGMSRLENRRIVLIGASGHGKVCAGIAELMGYHNILFLDDAAIEKCGDYRVAGVADDFVNYIDDQTDFFVSIGNAACRSEIQTKIEAKTGSIATLIHPASIIDKNTKIRKGSVIAAGAVINTGTSIGRGAIVNTSSSIDHDCQVGDWCHVAVGAHLCGTVFIGDFTWIGAGAIVSNNLTVCPGCMVGAGAVVIKNIEESGTYIGVPAKRISRGREKKAAVGDEPCSDMWKLGDGEG